MPSEFRRSSLVGLTGKTKPTVDITLNNPQRESFVPSFTTLEKIEGIVSLTCPTDLPFDDIHITFQGTTRTYVEKVATAAATNARSQAFHNFLRLAQPIKESEYPENRIAKAGQTYKFPFTFVVPERLLPQSCTHPKDTERVLDAHLNLPPSMGDPMMSSDGKTLLDDLAPDMTVISYAIRVIMFRRCPSSRKPITVIDRIKKLRIIPAVSELPPIPVSGTREDDYILHKEKDVKRGMFKGKLGRITMEASQPRALHLPSIHTDVTQSRVTTMAVINLRFDPVDESAKPPRLTNLSNRLKAATFYASVPLRDFPSRNNGYVYDTQRGVFVETLHLSCRNIESAQWTPHTTLERHDSAISISSVPSTPPSTTFYTSEILVPIELPTTTKTFVPTFHSCLASRVYSLDLTLNVQGPSATVSSTSLHLKLPLQISAEGNPDARPTISEAEMQAIAARQVATELLPRSIAPPSPEYTEVAQLAQPANGFFPPSPMYEEFPSEVRRASAPPGSENTPRGSISGSGDLMRGVRQRDLELLSEERTEGESSGSGQPPGYDASRRVAIGIRASWGGGSQRVNFGEAVSLGTGMARA